MICLWLDDSRDPVLYWAEGWTWVKTAAEAIEVLRTHQVEEASLDHDILGPSPGLAVVEWMRDNDVWPTQGTRVHSTNREGAAKMQALVDQHYGENRYSLDTDPYWTRK